MRSVSPLAAITPRREQGAGSLQQASLSSYRQCGACQGSVGAFCEPTLIICKQGVCCGYSKAWSEDAVTSVATVVSILLSLLPGFHFVLQGPHRSDLWPTSDPRVKRSPTRGRLVLNWVPCHLKPRGPYCSQVYMGEGMKK